MKIYFKTLNADAQELAGGNAGNATATTNAPVTAHDDFDWSVDKRNVSHYAAAEREKYSELYEKYCDYHGFKRNISLSSFEDYHLGTILRQQPFDNSYEGHLLILVELLPCIFPYSSE